MKKLLILGAGTGGTIMANKMRKALAREQWEITIVDQHKTHYYQPGFLFIPFGMYTRDDVLSYGSVVRQTPATGRVSDRGSGSVPGFFYLP